jgi:uncharacterized membrane protein YphA (DoxX/SURF4 family)
MAAPATTTRALRGATAIERIPWIAVLRIGLGALFVSTFFENLEKKLYTVNGYQGLIDDYAARNNAPGFWSDGFMGFISDGASFFAPVQAVFELALAVLLVLGIATGLVALIAAGHLTALWISELGLFWVWELLTLMIVATVVGLAGLPALLDRSRPMRERILGPPTFGALAPVKRIAVGVACGLALAGALLAAKTGGAAHDQDVALESGVVFGLLVIALGYLDERRRRA